MITTDNYFTVHPSIPVDKLPELLAEKYDFVKELTEDHTTWKYYNADEEIQKTVAQYFADLWDFLESKKASPKANKPAPKAKTVAKKRTAKKAAPAPKPAPSIEKYVRELDLELRLIRRFVNIDSKPRRYSQVLAFLNAINRAAEKGQVRKTKNPTKYHKEIEWIQQMVAKALAKSYKGDDPDEIAKSGFEPKQVAKFRAILKSYEVYPSVRLALRYYSMAGKIPNPNKAEALRTAIKKLIATGDVPKSDPNSRLLPMIENSLTDYLVGNTKELKVNQATLAGIGNALNGCGCTSSESLNGHEPAFDIIHEEKPRTGDAYFQPSSRQSHKPPQQPKEDIIPAPKGNRLSYKANNMPLADEDTLAFTGRWQELFGNPIRGFSAMIYGPPKSGKSTLSVDLGGYLARDFGNVLYASIEEGARGTITERIKRLSAGHPRMTVTNYLPSDIGKYGFVIVDSVSRGEMDIDAMRHVIRANPKTTFIFIFHVTKSGLPRGTSEFQHEVDVVVEVKDGQASAIGRFGPGETDVRFD